MELLQEFYETTLEALKDAKNDRLWFKTNCKVSNPIKSSRLFILYGQILSHNLTVNSKEFAVIWNMF